ncbi:hypothetical protein DM02DRAFT_694074 [Periconia macrospinosa]|uniref:Uncharacterized protein n=1 Tax=Periconia macrospinosa TaxID=97972 RepID=A0A2V1D7S9_9PLEO|nr:hypothetical protein DM02DRAFT_694074 [Periconia macrospinosa]
MTQISNITPLREDFKSASPDAKQQLFNLIRLVYKFCEPEHQSLRKANILPDETEDFENRVLSADQKIQRQGVVLLNRLFVLSGVSCEAIAEPDHSFSPNENLEVLIEIFRMKDWTYLGMGMTKLSGESWSKLVSCLGWVWEHRFPYVPPMLARLLSNLPCEQLYALYEEFSAYNVPLNVGDTRHESSIKILISLWPCRKHDLAEYAMCYPAVEWMHDLCKKISSFNAETRCMMLMAASSMLSALIAVLRPANKHLDFHRYRAQWIDPFASRFRISFDCCEYHVWVQMEIEIRKELRKVVESCSETLLGIVDRFLLFKSFIEESENHGEAYERHSDGLQETGVSISVEVQEEEEEACIEVEEERRQPVGPTEEAYVAIVRKLDPVLDGREVKTMEIIIHMLPLPPSFKLVAFFKKSSFPTVRHGWISMVKQEDGRLTTNKRAPERVLSRHRLQDGKRLNAPEKFDEGIGGGIEMSDQGVSLLGRLFTQPEVWDEVENTTHLMQMFHKEICPIVPQKASPNPTSVEPLGGRFPLVMDLLGCNLTDIRLFPSLTSASLAYRFALLPCQHVHDLLKEIEICLQCLQCFQPPDLEKSIRDEAATIIIMHRHPAVRLHDYALSPDNTRWYYDYLCRIEYDRYTPQPPPMKAFSIPFLVGLSMLRALQHTRPVKEQGDVWCQQHFHPRYLFGRVRWTAPLARLCGGVTVEHCCEEGFWDCLYQMVGLRLKEILWELNPYDDSAQIKLINHVIPFQSSSFE